MNLTFKDVTINFKEGYSVCFEEYDGEEKWNGRKYTYRATIIKDSDVIISYLTFRFANKTNAKGIIQDHFRGKL